MANKTLYDELKERIIAIHDAEKEASVTNVMVADLFKSIAENISLEDTIKLAQQITEDPDMAVSGPAVKKYLDGLIEQEVSDSVVKVPSSKAVLDAISNIETTGTLDIEQKVSTSTTKVPSSNAVLQAIANRIEGIIGYNQVKQYLQVNQDTLRNIAGPHIFQLMAGGRNVGLLMVIGDTSATTLNLLLFTRQNVSGTEIQNTFVNGLPKLYTGAYVFATDYMSDWEDVSGSVGSGSTGSSGGTSDLKKYSIWIELQPGDEEQPQWVVTEMSEAGSVIVAEMERAPENVLLDIVVKQAPDFEVHVPAMVGLMERGGAFAMATYELETIVISIGDKPEDCQVDSMPASSDGDVDMSRYATNDALNAFMAQTNGKIERLSKPWIVVSKLPEVPESGNEGKVHLVPLAQLMSDGSVDMDATGITGAVSDKNIYVEFVWVNAGSDDEPRWIWEKLGQYKMSVDLSGYLKGIRTYNGNTLEADKNGYIYTKYGDIYLDKASDEDQDLLELKVNPNGSIQQKVGIETPDTESLVAEAGKLYRFDNEVNTLHITLPEITDDGFVHDIMLHFTTGSLPHVTIEQQDDQILKFAENVKIEPGSTYEMSILWDGKMWCVALLSIKNE